MKVADLDGTPLDCWVAKAKEMEFFQRDGFCWYEPESGEQAIFSPSERWEDGGPIIESNNISLSPPTSRVHRHGGPNGGWGECGMWTATTWHAGVDGRRALAWDTTRALVAAMRCFVRLKFGDTVPDEVP